MSDHCWARVGPQGIPATQFRATGCGTVKLLPSYESAMAYNFSADPIAPHAAVLLKRVGAEYPFWLIKAVS